MIWTDRLAICWALLIMPLMIWSWAAQPDRPYLPPGWTIDQTRPWQANLPDGSSHTISRPDLAKVDLPSVIIRTALILVALPWFVLRSLHFMCTGRIRPKNAPRWAPPTRPAPPPS